MLGGNANNDRELWNWLMICSAPLDQLFYSKPMITNLKKSTLLACGDAVFLL